MKKALLLVAVLGLAVATQADIVPIDQFTGAQTEGYETQVAVFVAQIDVFGDGSQVISTGAPNLLITTGWSFFCTIFPHGEAKFMAGAGCNYRFVFAGNGAQRFGGFFGTNADVPNATANFYDTNGTLIVGNVVVGAALCDWTWNGWEQNDPNGPAIGSVEIIADNQFGGFIDSDDLTYDPAGGGPQVCHGDANCDGQINFSDINPFVLALSDFAGWQAAFPNCPTGNVDVNGDGSVNFSDINPFVELLTGGGSCH